MKMCFSLHVFSSSLLISSSLISPHPPASAVGWLPWPSVHSRRLCLSSAKNRTTFLKYSFLSCPVDLEDVSAREPGCLVLERDLMLSGELEFGDSEIIGLDRDAGKSPPLRRSKPPDLWATVS